MVGTNDGTGHARPATGCGHGTRSWSLWACLLASLLAGCSDRADDAWDDCVDAHRRVIKDVDRSCRKPTKEIDSQPNSREDDVFDDLVGGIVLAMVESAFNGDAPAAQSLGPIHIDLANSLDDPTQEQLLADLVAIPLPIARASFVTTKAWELLTGFSHQDHLSKEQEILRYQVNTVAISIAIERAEDRVVEIRIERGAEGRP